MSVEESIIRDIFEAFPARHSGGFSPLVNSVGLEPDDVEAAFRDKTDWTALDPTWLDRAPDGLASALSFLAAEALCFFMPGYLVADLRGQLRSADPAFILTYGLDTMTRDKEIGPPQSLLVDHVMACWRPLTPQQRAVIVRYLEWRSETDFPETRRSIVAALDNYWRRP